MPQRDQQSASDAVSQVIFSPDQDWNDLVEHRFPTDLETQAQALGAFQRARGVSSARVLLRAVLCDVLSLSSLKELSGWGRLVGVTTQVLASHSWHERLWKCGPWLRWLCQHLWGSLLPVPALPTQQRILWVDATHLAQMGPKGDILVGDGAYSRASQLVAVDQAKAFSLTRFSPRHLPVYASQAPADTPEFRLDVLAWLTPVAVGTFQRRVMLQSSSRVLDSLCGSSRWCFLKTRPTPCAARSSGKPATKDAPSAQKPCFWQAFTW